MGDYVFLRAAVYMLVRKVSPRGPMCFRCLMLRLSGPTDLDSLGNYLSNDTTFILQDQRPVIYGSKLDNH